MKKTHGLDEREMELVKLLMADCQTNRRHSGKAEKAVCRDDRADARS